jgi:hypothetical protein
MAFPRFHPDKFLTWMESKWSLWNLLLGTGLVASFSLPAWAVSTAQIFSQYAPFSWVVAGFTGVLAGVVAYLMYAVAYKRLIEARYNARYLDKGVIINPLVSVRGQFDSFESFVIHSALPDSMEVVSVDE